jgi:hypothetical protein
LFFPGRVDAVGTPVLTCSYFNNLTSEIKIIGFMLAIFTLYFDEFF